MAPTEEERLKKLAGRFLHRLLKMPCGDEITSEVVNHFIQVFPEYYFPVKELLQHSTIVVQPLPYDPNTVCFVQLPKKDQNG